MRSDLILPLRTELWRRRMTVTALSRVTGLRRERLSRILNCRLKPRQRDRRLISRCLGLPMVKLFGQPLRSRARVGPKK